MIQAECDENTPPPTPPSSVPPQIQPTLSYVTKFNLNTKGEFQCRLNSVPAVMMADSGSARNLVSSDVLALILGEFYLNYLEKKSMRPIYDCNSKLLKILGAVQLKVSIDKFNMEAEFICYQGTNKTVLLGFLTMHEANLVVYPRLGLFHCDMALDNQGDACFAAGDVEPEVVVEAQELLLPVAARTRLSIPPGQCANVPAEVLLPALTPADKKSFLYSTFVFHSEKLQDYLPLAKISCYYQYQCVLSDMNVTLRYCNHTKQTQLIYPGQIIAHAQEMSECSDDEIKVCNDDVLKYVFSIFKPDVKLGEGPSDTDHCPEKGTPPQNNATQVSRQSRATTVTPRAHNHATSAKSAPKPHYPENANANANIKNANSAAAQPAFAAKCVSNHAASQQKFNPAQNTAAAGKFNPARKPAVSKFNLAQNTAAAGKFNPAPKPAISKFNLAQKPAAAEKFNPAQKSATAEKFNPAQKYATAEKFNPAQKCGSGIRQPSLITSNASTPYTYKTGPHELKGPTELEGGFKLSDIKIESNDPDERAFIYEMYETYKDAVSQHEYDAGTYTGDRMTFTLKKGTQTYHARPYAIPSHLKPQADALVNQLVAAGIVGKMTAPAVHIAPLHFVQKAYADLPPHLARYAGEKDTSKPRKLRAVINHRMLNACVELPTRFPQTTIPEILRKMHAATVASSTDLRAAYYALKMSPDVFPYMAFEYANELWYFRRCPMGFVMSSFALSAATQFMKMRYGLTQCEFLADDCLIWGETAEDYRTQVRKFFSALSATGFKLHPLKSTWFVRTNLPVLGFILNLPCKSLLASPQKIKALMTTSRPRSKREIRRFVGAVSFLSQFIFGLQQLLRPLHTAASPKVPFAWSRDCEFSWRTIQRSVASLPALKLPSPHYPLDLHTDGSPNSSRSLCWLWAQNQGGPETYLVQFGSRCLSKEHLALSQPELELLCLLSALQTDSHLVAYTSLRCHTDAKGLTYLATYQDSQSKLRRWTLFLQSLPLTLCFTRNTSSLIRLTDFLGRQRKEVIKALKIKKPLGKDCLVFPTYNFEGISPMPFEHCWAFLKEVVEMQRLAQLEVGYPLMPDLEGTWRPLDGLIHYKSTSAPPAPPLDRLRLVPAARCVQPPVSDPDVDPCDQVSVEQAGMAQPPHGTEMPPQQKVEEWKGRHWANAHLLPRPPDTSPSLAYNLTKPDRMRHHLPSLHHQSEYTNPTLNLRPGPLLLHRYEICNLQQDEKQPALRFLLVANAELRGVPLLAVRREQKLDPDCGSIIQRLQGGEAVKGYALFNGLLLRVTRQPGLKLTLMLPQSLGAKYLAFLHESTTLFHLQASTLTRLAGKYFTIKQMSKLALQVTQDCFQCQLHNRQSHQTAVRGKRFTLSAPRQLLYADVCSFFTGKCNKSYFVIVDGFSFLTSAYVVSTPETSDQLATHLIHYFSSHTTPSGICLDHASVHENVLAQALALLNVRKYQCSSRCPAPQLAERVHQYIIRLLALLSSSFKIKDAHLPCLVSFAIHVFNSTPLRSMGDRAPYAIHFGDNGNHTSCVPTIHVGKDTALPEYIKALARLQAATWQAVNDIKRKKERQHLKGGNPRRQPLYKPGDCVRMRTHVLATAKNHKLANSYTRHIYKVVKFLPKSYNYILLKLSDKNYFAHGFYSKQPLPKSCLTWAKESRLKRCNLRTACPDSLTGKLFALFAEVAFKAHPVPSDFQLAPQIGKTVAVDSQLQKLSEFVLKKNASRPAKPNVSAECIVDSEYGRLPAPSGSAHGPASPGNNGQAPQQQTLPQQQHRIVRAAKAVSFEAVVRKVLPPDLARLHLAAGCKPPGAAAGNDDEDYDSGGNVEDRQPAPARPQRNLLQSRACQKNAAPSPPVVKHNATQRPALGARPKEKTLTQQICPKVRPGRHAVTPPCRSPTPGALSTGTIDFIWDGTYDFAEACSSHHTPARQPLVASQARQLETSGAGGQICALNARNNVDDSCSGSGGNKDDDDEWEDERSFHSTRASPGGSVGTTHSDEGSLHEAEQPPVAGPPEPNLPHHPPPTAPPPPLFRHVSEAPRILDLKRIPSGSVSLHGPQVFGNYGVRGKDVTLKTSVSKKTKKSRTTKNSKKTQTGSPPPPSPPPPNPPSTGPTGQTT